LSEGKCTPLDAICHRVLARGSRVESSAAKIIVRLVKIFPSMFFKLEIDVQADGDVIAVL
jgi:hypothetical protein